MQVVLIGESQGGHVAARLADLAEPELLVLLASLPDIPDVERLRVSGIAMIVGWKVVPFLLHLSNRCVLSMPAILCGVYVE